MTVYPTWSPPHGMLLSHIAFPGLPSEVDLCWRSILKGLMEALLHFENWDNLPPLCAKHTTPTCQQAGYFLEQHPRIEWLADMSRTPGSHGALFFPGRDMSGDGNNRHGTKLTHLAQVCNGFPSIHVR